METTIPQIQAHLAAKIHRLRTERSLTIESFAERSGVSRSMISLIERGESSPTAVVLDRLADGLGVTLASLFTDDVSPNASPVARHDDQVLWTDPETGYVRRSLSPPGFPSPLEMTEISLPGGARITYDAPRPIRTISMSQQLWILDGRLDLTAEGATHRLAPGDCLAMDLKGPITFTNPTEHTTRYLLAVTNNSDTTWRGVPRFEPAVSSNPHEVDHAG